LKIPLRSNCFFGISQVVRWYIFKQKAQFGLFLEGLRIENVGIIYGHLVYFTAIWYILWPFGNLLVIFPALVYCVKKNLATLFQIPSCQAKFNLLVKSNSGLDESCSKDLSAECLNRNSLTK
jgi:hypothetical protein